MLNIGMASDHAGYELKEKIKDYLKKLFHDEPVNIIDFGTDSTESCDYPDFAHKLGNAIENKECDCGIAICGTGNGISMTVNKHSGCRDALCWNVEIAKLARQHNDANVLSLPARFITEDDAFAITEAFFLTNFEGGRHQRRIDKINI